MTSAAEPLIQVSLIGEALDGGPALVFVADEHMRYVAVNAFACTLLGYTREELLGMRVTDVCREPEAPEQFAALVERGAGGDGESDVALTRKDGSSFRIRCVAGETTVARMPFYVCVGCVNAA